MSSRRVPLASNPNAANSPYRAVAQAAAQKKRSHATIQREEAYANVPPAKKQMLENHGQNLRTPPRQTSSAAEGRVFTRRSNAPNSHFMNKLEAVRTKPTEETSDKNLETVRQWRKHYRRQFPKFVFYFESISDDVRGKWAKQVLALGARVEKFFSNEVSHVVTSRTPPPEKEPAAASSHHDATSHGQQPQTINPQLLERSSDEAKPATTKFTFEASVGRKPSGFQDLDLKRNATRSAPNADVLHRARDLGMKIWALEKLQRVITSLADGDIVTLSTHGHNTRSNSTAISRGKGEADLSQLLRNERLNGPSDRDPTVAAKELNLFKGPFIYVHDMDEKQKPIMVREYARVANKEDGDWPQFRSVANGKCPFVEEVDNGRQLAEEEMLRKQRKAEEAERARAAAPRTRAASALERMDPPKGVTVKRALSNMENGGNSRPQAAPARETSLLNPSKAGSAKPAQPEASSTRATRNAFISRAGPARLVGGEPLASGVQPSNVTSAIHSQMISSTAVAPGAKAGTSKEVHDLQRKVLEKNSTGPASYGQASSHRMTDTNAAPVKEEATVSRPVSRRSAKEQLGQIDEEDSAGAGRLARRAEVTKPKPAPKKKKRDAKPGYCENCQDKFDDFDDHILSRKHRKFAEKAENWKELDSLLSQLVRPLKDDYDDEPF